MTRRSRSALALLAFVLGGCGLKGPLYLPEKSGAVAVRPAPATPAPPSTGEPPAVPEKPAAPETPPQEPPQKPPTGTDRG